VLSETTDTGQLNRASGTAVIGSHQLHHTKTRLIPTTNFANFGDMNRLQAFLRRADKSGYYTGNFTITALCEQTDEQLFRALKYNPIHPLVVSYHLSAANHTSPVPEYIIMSYPSKTAVLTSATLFTAYCTRTAISVLFFFTFFVV